MCMLQLCGVLSLQSYCHTSEPAFDTTQTYAFSLACTLFFSFSKLSVFGVLFLHFK